MVAVALAPRLGWMELVSDDGLLASQSMLVAAGRLPYRDFFSISSPLPSMFYGGALALFGRSYLVYRLLTAASVLISVALIYLCGSRFLPPRWAAVVGALWGALSATELEHSPYHLWATTMALACALAVLRASRSERRVAWLASAGAAASLCGLFHQPAGAVLPLAAVAAALPAGGRLRSVLAYAAGGVAVGVLLLGDLLLTKSLEGFWQDAVLNPLFVFSGTTRQPIPWYPTPVFVSTTWEAGIYQHWFAALGWPLAFLLPAGLLVSLPATAALSWLGRLNPGVAAMQLVSGGLFISGLSFMTAPILWLCSPIALLLLAIGIHRALRILEPRPSRIAAGVLGTVLSALAVGPALIGLTTDCRVDPWSPLASVTVHGSAVCVPREERDSFAAIASFSDRHPHEAMAFMPTIAPFYLLSDHLPPVGYHFLVPGVQTPAQLEEVETQLIEGKVRWVVYDQFPWETIAASLPGNPALRMSSWQLEDWLSANYALTAESGRIKFLERDF